MVCIVDHLTSIHDGLDAGYEFLGVFVGLRYDVLQLGQSHMCVYFMRHPILYPLEEGRSICLGCFSFLFSSRWSPLCMELKRFCSEGCEDVAEVILTVRLNPVQEEPVVKCLSEQRKGTVSIFCVPVICRQ